MSSPAASPGPAATDAVASAPGPAGDPETLAGEPGDTPSGVTAVIVTRGRTPYLAATLQAVADQEVAPDQVVVVDVDQHRARGLRIRSFGDAVDLVVRAQLDAERRTEVGGGLVAPSAADAGLLSGLDPRVRASATTRVDEGPSRWLWLLHDDSAPAPEALRELLRAVEHRSSVVLAGAKQCRWDDPDVLLEVGVTVSPTGRRMTGIEDDEIDQGQHDAREDVLAVGLAGALVRTDAWVALGGTDPAYGAYGDGLDLSRRARLAGHRVIVVPSAVVRHAQASLRGVRAAEPAPVVFLPTGEERVVAHAGEDDPDASFRERRRSLVHGRTATAPALLVPVVLLGMVLWGPVRAAVRLVARNPRLALAELVAPLQVLVRPGALRGSRRLQRSSARLPRKSLRPLQASWRDVHREHRDRRLARAARRHGAVARNQLEQEELRQATIRRRWVLALVVALLGALCVALFGPAWQAVASGGRLVGGSLLPADADLSRLWDAVREGWVRDGFGAPAPSDPLLTAFLLPTALLGGSLQAVVHVLMLGSPLLAGLGAWYAAGTVSRSVFLRLWASLAWAAVPVLAQGVSSGRIGAVLTHVALPWAACWIVRGLGLHAPAWVPHERVLRPAPEPGSRARRRGSVTFSAAGGLALAAAVAGSPVLLPAVLAGLLLIALVAPAGRRRLLCWTGLAPIVVCLPLAGEVARGGLRDGWALLSASPGPAVPAPVADAWGYVAGLAVRPSEWFGLAADDSGPGGLLARGGPYAVGGVVVALAIGALVRRGPAGRAVRVLWVVAALAVGTAVLCARAETGVAGTRIVHGWPGAAVSLAFLALTGAAMVALEGLARQTARRSFGWRQVGLALVSLLVLALPVAGGLSWVHRGALATAEGAAERSPDAPVLQVLTRPVVPPVGQQLQQAPRGARVLVLQQGDDGAVGFDVLAADGAQLTDSSAVVGMRELRAVTGDASQAGDAAGQTAPWEDLRSIVAQLASGAATDQIATLEDWGIGAVLVPVDRQASGDPAAAGEGGDSHADARARLVGRLDLVAGLQRITEGASGAIWRVAPEGGAPASWARLQDAPAGVEEASRTPVDGGIEELDTVIPAGAAGRVLLLNASADPGWRARLDGVPLAAVDAGWRQAFEVGEDGGRLVVERDGGRAVPVVGAAVSALYAVLLLPIRRRGAAR